jgi:soluble lytic murein transglycosylase
VEPNELHYWQGRLEELRNRPEAALENYLTALVEDPDHPFGTAARRRLESPPLAALSRRRGEELATAASIDDLYRAWLLLPPQTPLYRRSEAALRESLARDAAAVSFLRLEVEPTAAWPLWQAEMSRPEEMLVGLGLFDEGATEILRHFPVTQPDLAFTGSVVLARSGEIQRSLYIAEILLKRVPRAIPAPLLPVAFQRLLYPMSYRELILTEASRRGVDPHLLTAIIREESRFDPRAFSAASARGLTQFIFTTAREIAAAYEMGPVEPRDLERPEVSIALGAAYLNRLYEELDGAVPEVVAAYNAGKPQAALWRRYCHSDEPEEYLSKVAFRETRGYLTKVLKSRQRYAELYPTPAEPPPLRDP